MTIWRGTTTIPKVGPGIVVKRKFFGHSNVSNAEVAEAVSKARVMIQDAVRQTQGEITPFAKKAAAIYFKTPDAGPDAADLNIIRQVLLLTSAGLQAPGLEIKADSKKGADGYVNVHSNDSGRVMDALRIMPAADDGTIPVNEKKNWSMDHKEGATHWVGSIHVKADLLKRNRLYAASVIIHEATHRFASTDDFGDRGYINDNNWREYRNPGLTKAEALNNADSYAFYSLRLFQGI